ncbi:deoxycytidylate deaminase-like isoform X1 [Alosa sapidissima]|uniref:deoxycytidylate deaminase-like isoform X1 n=2 Tax=Alosa sapidissima TaxID=34773 RepID=UPI001C0A4E24|nr:deoxycytidylate deaminase-like isoform X1 [Alosa sapidissima]
MESRGVTESENKMDNDTYFMAVAVHAAKWSPDPNTKVGACIVNPDKKIVGIGYNRMPNGCPNESLPWARESEDPLGNKYLYVCHAELNAIMNKTSADVKGCTIYVSLFPCNECTKIIIQSGIKDMIYLSDKYKGENTTKASKRMLDLAGIPYRVVLPASREIVIDFGEIAPGLFGNPPADPPAD